MNNMSYLSKGKEVEKEFATLFNKKTIFSNREQDINEHWDVEIEGFKYDVKGLKKINRNDPYTNELYHFIEIKNVNGDNGWAYGKADFFAFETNRYFIVVPKEKLQDFISKNIKKEYVNSPDKALYCLYTRENRKDVITMITSIDLCMISDNIYKKNKTTHFNIGESVIPDIRKQDRLNNLF